MNVWTVVALALGVWNLLVWVLVVVAFARLVAKYRPLIAPLVEAFAVMGGGVTLELDGDELETLENPQFDSV